MRSPSPPANERERLAALARHAILDTEPEDAYDDIAALAAHVCGTPIALVSLVAEHRQWFKARVGLDVRETARDIGFCAHVVECGELLVVEDTRTDERFADNPFVSADAGVAFYAGAPLQTREGFTLGTLCAIDRRPRRLSDEQLAMLAALSRLVVRQLELRLAERERQAVEAELLAARERADRAHWLRQRFFEASLDMLCIAGFDGYFKELNPAWSTTLGWTPEELSAKPFIDFVHPDDRAYTISEAAALGQGDHVTVRFENRYLCKSGEYRWLSWTSAPDMTNQVLLATARDVTLAKAREHELTVARQLAETANQAKSDFLAKMSHELRTPLNSVIGFTSLLVRNKKGNLDGQDLIWLDKIAKNGLHLLSLINDLLDLSKIEAGHAEMNWGEVDVAELIRAVFEQLEGAVAADGNCLTLTLPDALAPIRADARRLKQILINLIGNANKFTKRGTIELRVVCRPDAASKVARIDVVDSGIGIPVAQRERVFEAFRQVSEGDARAYGGTGLGLTISRSLAQLHGFELGVVSREGHGSTFYLALEPGAAPREHVDPLGFAGGERATRTAPPQIPLASHRMVLLIDDDGEARLLAAKAVEQLGARVVCADSGEAGFTIAQAIQPDLIVLDLGLPDVHGREIVRRLSADPRLRHVPVVIYSGQVDHALDMIGSASVLEKPVTLAEIASVVGQHLGPRRRVLIVDDDEDTREVLRTLIHRLGVETTEAGDGEEALRSLRSFAADLILLDICMPNMTGFEFLARLREDPSLAAIPVVVCTALDLDLEHEVQLADENRAVIRKGYNVEGRLEEILRGMIRRGMP
ncbi:response regulator [Nannocystaceae bacterium ST9]